MHGYSPDKKPLGGYAALTAAFNAAAVGYVVAHRRSRRKLPGALPFGDFALMALGTQKLSRLIAKDRVTSFARSPFTRYTGEAGPGEVSEEPRGSGLQRAVGELLVCPHCVGQWVAAGIVGSYLISPDATRMFAGVFAIVSTSDFLQQLWVALESRA
ncbi:MAG: DUF1360 domain-containing protein [Solirubrobacterales bacterium]|nr:DUF1360 domain-containing protein [Solirubrobacterales bacterium]